MRPSLDEIQVSLAAGAAGTGPNRPAGNQVFGAWCGLGLEHTALAKWFV